MRQEEPITLDYARGFAMAARSAFKFLENRGFELLEYREPESASFRDGFRLRYRRGEVEVLVEYFDMEIGVTFVRGAIRAAYLLIDHEMFGNAIGFAGSMFPLDKLGDALEKISADISSNYGRILGGDPVVWANIERMANAPVRKARHPFRNA
jgi:hypothetical protein